MKSHCNQRGFSFVEVLGGTTALLLMAGTLAGTTLTSIEKNRKSRDVTAAVALAHERIEELRSQEPWVLAELESGQEGPLDPLAGTDGHRKFMRSWTVTPDTPVKGTSLVRVTVSWGPNGEYQVETAAIACVTHTCS